jgi:hypothetical protein
MALTKHPLHTATLKLFRRATINGKLQRWSPILASRGLQDGGKVNWRSMDILLHKVAAMAQNLLILCWEENRVLMQAKIGEIKRMARQVLWLPM